MFSPIVNEALWTNTFYLENFGLILGFLVLLGVPLFFLKNNKLQVQGSWASVKSWIVALPFLFFFIGLPEPGPFVFLVLVSIYSAKCFLQMVGAYHRSLFVGAVYISIALSSYAIYIGQDVYFLLAPAISLFIFCMLPLVLNNPKNMVQYISLSFICFCLFGWNIIIAGKFFPLEKGLYLLLYLYVLSEFSANVTNAISLILPSPTVLPNITTKAKWSGFLISFALTILLAWGFRRLLFNTSELYWVSAGLICFFSAHFGEWVLSTFRRDLGIKNQGVFIIGRGDLLSRTNRVMFSYPFFTLFLILTKDISFNI